jgi:hypothetical protein
MDIKNTTIADNRVRIFGGAGIQNGGTMKVINSTIAKNRIGGLGSTAVGNGADVQNFEEGVLELQNSIDITPVTGRTTLCLCRCSVFVP